MKLRLLVVIVGLNDVAVSSLPVVGADRTVGHLHVSVLVSSNADRAVSARWKMVFAELQNPSLLRAVIGTYIGLWGLTQGEWQTTLSRNVRKYRC
jgi:hypothetical protein